MDNQAFELLKDKLDDIKSDITVLKNEVGHVKEDLGHYKGFLGGVTFVFTVLWSGLTYIFTKGDTNHG